METVLRRDILMVLTCEENRGGYSAGSLGEIVGGGKETSWQT